MTKLDRYAAKNSERTDRTEAREALGMGGGVSEPRSNSGFGRYLQRRKRNQAVMLTTDAEVEKDTPETTTPKSVTGAADIELAQTLGETRNLDERKQLEADQRKHFLFRTHRYLPGMSKPGDPLVAGAYRREKGRGQGRPGGLINMANEHEIDRRN
jgi:hypothetical protein